MIRIALFALALLATPARAEITGWTLALTWQPGFCALNARSVQCATDTKPRLVLHGLWTEGMGDEFCGVAPDVRARDKQRAWCELPLPQLKATTATTLKRIMPGTADCLEHHEWTKHGTCSGMDADTYFAVTADLADKASRLQTARLLQERAGGVVSLAELDSSIARDLGPDGVKSVLPVCSRRGESVHFVELRISLDAKKYRAFPKPEALLRREKWFDPRCPADRPINLGAR